MAGGTASAPVGAIGQRVPHDRDVTFAGASRRKARAERHSKAGFGATAAVWGRPVDVSYWHNPDLPGRLHPVAAR
jgi:hypothetical protein